MKVNKSSQSENKFGFKPVIVENEVNFLDLRLSVDKDVQIDLFFESIRIVSELNKILIFLDKIVCRLQKNQKVKYFSLFISLSFIG